MVELSGEDKIGLKLEVISDIFNGEKGGCAINLSLFCFGTDTLHSRYGFYNA